MTLEIREIRVPLGQEKVDPRKSVANLLQIDQSEILNMKLRRKAVDARHKENIKLVFSFEVDLKNEQSVLARFPNSPHIIQKKNAVEPDLAAGLKNLKHRPVIIGTGPAGIFAAIKLAEYGYHPIVLERGKDVGVRQQDVQSFWGGRKLNCNSNVQFGEGGAGTFSDGKLTTRINDFRIEKVFQYFIDAGAPEEIAYLQKPHIGTDKLRIVVKRLRDKLHSLGGKVLFNARVTDIIVEDDKVTGVMVNKKQFIPTDVVILAVGHSARDTYEMLAEKKIAIQAKPFAIGVRIEHPQKVIDLDRFGKYAGHPTLGAGDYSLVYKGTDENRAAYSFCMCPGGQVVCASSETEGVVTNGMSDYARNAQNANSALVVPVGLDDFSDKGPLAGVKYQRKWEQLAFKVGGKSYAAPAQKVGDLMRGRESSDTGDWLKPTFKPKVKPGDLYECLPDFVVDTLKDAVTNFEKKIKGFSHPEAVMTGVETRTSAPVRILRNKEYVTESLEGLYPCGEGAGYSGGIVSSAVDGIKIAEAVISLYRRPSQINEEITVEEE